LLQTFVDLFLVFNHSFRSMIWIGQPELPLTATQTTASAVAVPTEPTTSPQTTQPTTDTDDADDASSSPGELVPIDDVVASAPQEQQQQETEQDDTLFAPAAPDAATTTTAATAPTVPMGQTTLNLPLINFLNHCETAHQYRLKMFDTTEPPTSLSDLERFMRTTLSKPIGTVV
jgi:hypothetical protein